MLHTALDLQISVPDKTDNHALSMVKLNGSNGLSATASVSFADVSDPRSGDTALRPRLASLYSCIARARTAASALRKRA